MASKKRGLGRGLNALLGDVTPTEAEKTIDLHTLPIEFLQRGKYQPRKDIKPEALQELADSIRAQGIIQPVVVRAITEDKYEIIAGERRWRAAQLAQLEQVPVVVKQIDDRSAMAVALIENIQREDLNILEECEAIKRLVDEFDMTHQQAANAVGKSRAMVSNLLRLLELPKEIKSLMAKAMLEMGHARALLSLDQKKQLEIANKIIKLGLTVRQTEALVKDASQSPQSNKQNKDHDTLRLQEQLTEKTGAKVTINHQKNGKGKLIFNYTSLEELEGIINRIN